MSGTTPFCIHKAQKRSGIPIAPSETESAAWHNGAKRCPPSPIRRVKRRCRERFQRKYPGVFDLLDSSLSFDATSPKQPNKHLYLQSIELCSFTAQTKRRTTSGFRSCSPQRCRLLRPLGLKRLQRLLSSILTQIRCYLSSGSPLGT